MRKMIYTLILGSLFPILTMGQSTISLSFTCFDNLQHIAADSFRVMNLTQGGDTVLYHPDSVLLLEGTAQIGEFLPYNPKSFKLEQNYPNPFSENTSFEVQLPKSGKLFVDVHNSTGQLTTSFVAELPAGAHRFSFFPGNEIFYFVNPRFQDSRKVLKMCALGENSNGCDLKYTGYEKTFEGDFHSDTNLKSAKSTTDFMYTQGDKLAIVAFNALGQSGCFDAPVSDTLYEIQFATNIPCPGIDSLEYEGQYYHTIQIYDQCWMKENLNVGLQLNSTNPQTDNGTVEKYCLLNDVAQCDRYGGIYTWDEMMNYSSEEGSQGICPAGWHVASDDDFKVLEGAIDSNYGIGDPEWENFNENGIDAGTKMKSTSGWSNGGNGTDSFGFSALWGGFLYQGMWAGGNLFGTLFTSTSYGEKSDKAIHRGFSWMYTGSERDKDLKSHARPIRCIKN
ncbi:MAG: hypothetical protein K9H64_15240 [Bacteroidales bacterium]|nr:hypothetical protein [Bacteroidales bacterium]MCF8457353.1 hypothetical protein [Bacteroidales bacterium]